jgi:acyl carrier protein
MPMRNDELDDIRDRIHAIVAEQAMIDIGDVTDEMTPEELGIDSMGLVEAIFAIEESFDIRVPFNANEPRKSDFDYSSVGAIVRAVRRLVAEQRA